MAASEVFSKAFVDIRYEKTLYHSAYHFVLTRITFWFVKSIFPIDGDTREITTLSKNYQ